MPASTPEPSYSVTVTWQGKLVCDDYAAYKASFTQGIVEVGCSTHARRKFFELHASTQSETAAKALEFFGELYAVEREVRDFDAEQALHFVRRRLGR